MNFSTIFIIYALFYKRNRQTELYRKYSRLCFEIGKCYFILIVLQTLWIDRFDFFFFTSFYISQATKHGTKKREEKYKKKQVFSVISDYQKIPFLVLLLLLLQPNCWAYQKWNKMYVNLFKFIIIHTNCTMIQYYMKLLETHKLLHIYTFKVRATRKSHMKKIAYAIKINKKYYEYGHTQKIRDFKNKPLKRTNKQRE